MTESEARQPEDTNEAGGRLNIAPTARFAENCNFGQSPLRSGSELGRT